MNLDDLLAEVSRSGGILAVGAGKLHYRGPRRGLTPELRNAISQQKDELLSVLAHKDQGAWVWPPLDAVELVVKWNQLERPQIPLCPGVSIADLGKWLSSNYQEEQLSDQLGVVRRFLWEGLPKIEVPMANILLEEWRRISIPEWRRILVESTDKVTAGVRNTHGGCCGMSSKTPNMKSPNHERCGDGVRGSTRGDPGHEMAVRSRPRRSNDSRFLPCPSR